jgi:4-amino-4-deoxy-L-arabinose transferase-like glycosyltransferase
VKSSPAALLALPVVSIYALYLQRSPVYLAHDEVFFALQAHSIASSGHDLNGRFLPLYFQIAAAGFWATPVTIYLTALFLKFLPVSDAVIRLPSVLVGLVDIWLVYLVARRIFARETPALVAAALLALTPAHFIHSRLAYDELYPVPFVLAWLLCMASFVERRRLSLLFAGTALLGVGVYSYIASVILMPLYVLLTCVVLIRTPTRSARPYIVAIVGFAAPAILLVPWLLTHPAQYGDEIRMFSLYDTQTLGPLQGLRRMLSWTSVGEHLSVYYNYFDPSFLFFSGDTSIHSSTRQAGVFLLPLAIFLPVGIWQVARHWRTGLNLVLLLGLVSAPVAATLVGQSYRINRALVMLPFAALIATFGADYLLTARHRALRIAGVALLVLVPVQFASFYRDYLTDYRVRSSVWFERNLRGGLESILDITARRREAGRRGNEVENDVPAVYLNKNIGWIGYYWQFYLLKHHRYDLLNQTIYFDPRNVDLSGAPKGSLILSRCGEAARSEDEALASSSLLKRVTVITEPDEKPSFVVLEK